MKQLNKLKKRINVKRITSERFPKKCKHKAE